VTIRRSIHASGEARLETIATLIIMVHNHPTTPFSIRLITLKHIETLLNRAFWRLRRGSWQLGCKRGRKRPPSS